MLLLLLLCAVDTEISWDGRIVRAPCRWEVRFCLRPGRFTATDYSRSWLEREVRREDCV